MIGSGRKQTRHRSTSPAARRGYPVSVADDSPVDQNAWISAGYVNMSSLCGEICRGDSILCPYAVYIHKRSSGGTSLRYLRTFKIQSNNENYEYQEVAPSPPPRKPFSFRSFFAFLGGSSICFFCAQEQQRPGAWLCYLFAPSIEAHKGTIEDFARQAGESVTIRHKYPLMPSQFQRLLERMVNACKKQRVTDVHGLRTAVRAATKCWSSS